MGWHDCRVYAIAFASEPGTFEITFDIDYIIQWVEPKENGQSFSFWISPVTLVFENVFDIEFELVSYNGSLEIDFIEKEDVTKNAQHIRKHEEWIWTIKCQEGQIRFRSSGYKQYVRVKPKLGSQQVLDPETRETSFHRGPTENP